jgi:hypothetical protein
MTGAPVTELTLTGGERLRVEGAPRAIETILLSAARGSIMELAWLTEANTGHEVGVNPDHVMMIRALAGNPEP